MNKCIKKVGVFLLVASMAVGAKAEDLKQIRGSDTMVNLVQRLVEVYSEKNPGKSFSVTGGGSGAGVAGLRNRTVDLVNSSRDIKEREISDMRAKGVEPVGVIIAEDCITIVVNKENKLEKLTFAQLGAIFRGEIANWKELGGDDLPIKLYGRQSNSGTYVVFREKVLKDNYSDKMYRMNGNSQIAEAIKTDKSGIGYVGIGYVRESDSLKAIKVAEKEGEEYIDPLDRKAIDSGKYPLIRPLFQYTNGIPTGEIKDFIEFELSPEGQKIVDEMGFVPIYERDREQNKKAANI